MPDSPNLLPDEMTPDALEASIARRARNAACESCGSEDWGIQEGQYALAAISERGLNTGGGVPVNVVICDRCGFVRLYSVVIPTD
jgi:hypothetical protein